MPAHMRHPDLLSHLIFYQLAFMFSRQSQNYPQIREKSMKKNVDADLLNTENT